MIIIELGYLWEAKGLEYSVVNQILANSTLAYQLKFRSIIIIT